MTSVLFYPTMRCQLKCEYCHFKTEARKIPYTWSGYGKEHTIEREVEARDVLKFLEPFLPYHIEFSGGEPLLWPGFREFVANVPAGGRWAITSNTLEPVEDIDFKRCAGWTASWHVDSEKFKKNLLALHPKVGMAVSFVVKCDMEDIEKNIERAKEYASLGFRPNFLREVNPGVSWEGSDEWKKVVSFRELGWNVPEEDIPDKWEFDSGFWCRGGSRYFSIMPDGKVYRCYSDAMDGREIGRVGEPFKPVEYPYECHRDCYSCALDFAAHMGRV